MFTPFSLKVAWSGKSRIHPPWRLMQAYMGGGGVGYSTQLMTHCAKKIGQDTVALIGCVPDPLRKLQSHVDCPFIFAFCMVVQKY